IERERIASLLFEHGHQLSLRALSAGDHERAIRLAASSIRRRPLDEAGHVVLVKGLVLAGRPDAAADHVLATEREFASQLGEKPSLALRSAARQTIAAPPAGISQSTVITSLVEAGTAALAAGAVEAGLDCLRRAAESAESKRDDHLHAKALLELGKALVHAVRGYDDEGAIVLRQSVDLSRRCGSDPMAASGLRELGYVEALAGRRPSAATLLDEALACAHRDQDSLSGIHGTIAFNLVDWGRSEEGLDHYERSLDLARRAGNRRREIWSLGLGGWGQLRAERSAVAVTWLERCLENCQDTRWISFRPWPVAVLAEARLKQGADPGSLSERLEEAFALSCQLGDPCWEGATARGLALAHEGDGDVEAARHWLVTARKHCTRVSDQYKGLLVCILADQVRLAERAEDPEGARTFARELLSLASRTHADAHLGGALRALGLDPGI
ncbi:MAG: bacterial transcriptional activator domain-containing protein, partial [Microvirga sp.]